MALEIKSFELGQDLNVHVHCLDRQPNEFEVGESETIIVPLFKGFEKLSPTDKKTFLQNYISAME